MTHKKLHLKCSTGSEYATLYNIYLIVNVNTFERLCFHPHILSEINTLQNFNWSWITTFSSFQLLSCLKFYIFYISFIYIPLQLSPSFALSESISRVQIKKRSWRTRVLKLLLELWVLHISCGYPSWSTECSLTCLNVNERKCNVNVNVNVNVFEAVKNLK